MDRMDAFVSTGTLETGVRRVMQAQMNGCDKLKADPLTFRILRFKPGRVDPPRYVDFAVHFEPDMTVLDGLEQIRLKQAPGLMYRHCCHHASCGTCACMINGTAGLACITRVADLEGGVVTLAPLAHPSLFGGFAHPVSIRRAI